jgi:hypothetical protein
MKEQMCKTEGQMYKMEGQMCKTEGQMCKTEGQMCKTEGQMCKTEEQMCKTEEQIKNFEIKRICPITTTKITKTEKQKTKRVVTNTSKWSFSKEELEYENQLKLIKTLLIDNTKLLHPYNFILSQIKNKICSYREQDLRTNRYDKKLFIHINYILDKLKDCQLKCYYCKFPMFVLYENVRDTQQWTVERIDNKYGHNCNNIEIACLSCNIRRKTIHFERYLLTKQLCKPITQLL